jgi:hypothetical protein
LSANAFMLFLTLGAALMAMWTDQRFPGLTPNGFTRALLSVVASVIVLQVTGSVVERILDPPTPAGFLTATLVVALPALTFVFLSALWVIKIALRSFGGGIR